MAKSWTGKSKPEPDPIESAKTPFKPKGAEVDEPHTVTYVDSKDPSIVYGTGQCWCAAGQDH